VILAGHPDLEGLCLALSDWWTELRIQSEKSRWAETQRPAGEGIVRA
jgi:hypothetical protein